MPRKNIITVNIGETCSPLYLWRTKEDVKNWLVEHPKGVRKKNERGKK